MKIMLLLILTIIWIPFGLILFPIYVIYQKLKKYDISTDIIKMFLYWLLFPIMHKIIYASRYP